MNEQIIRELAIIKAYEIKYGTDEFLVMDALMERNGFYGNWSVDVVGDTWDEIDKMASEIYAKLNDYING